MIDSDNVIESNQWNEVCILEKYISVQHMLLAWEIFWCQIHQGGYEMQNSIRVSFVFANHSTFSCFNCLSNWGTSRYVFFKDTCPITCPQVSRYNSGSIKRNQKNAFGFLYYTGIMFHNLYFLGVLCVLAIFYAFTRSHDVSKPWDKSHDLLKSEW